MSEGALSSGSARRGQSRLPLRILLLATLLAVGLWARSLPTWNIVPGLPGWWPWKPATVVTLYFSDGWFLFPVSRRMPTNNDLPREVLQALLTGPSADSSLTNPIPPGVQIRSLQVADGIAYVDLSAGFLVDQSDTQEAQTAILETLTALPGVSSVALSVEGEPLAEPAKRTPLLYYPSANGLVAVPVSASTPRDALTMFLAGPPKTELTGLPRDVRLLAYEYDPADGLLSLNFSYTPSIRELALEQPERMRLLLLGLITGLTEFSQVRAVRLDFEGRTRLGMGQCSDLLRTPQPRPALLNDERLLG